MASAKEGTKKQTAKAQPGLFTLQGGTVEPFNMEAMLEEDWAGTEWVSNFNPTDPQFMEFAFLIDKKSMIEVDSKTAERLPVCWWCAQRHNRFADDSGNNQLGVTLCLITPERKWCTVTSKPCLRFWQKVITMRNVGPWEPPIHICFDKQKSGAGRTYFDLRLVP